MFDQDKQPHQHSGGEQPHAHSPGDKVMSHDDGDWEKARPSFRQRWEQQNAGQAWDDHEADYRYAWDMRRRPEYQDRQWTDVESDFRRDWATRHPDRRWEEHQEHVRGAWDDDDVRTIQLREEELIARKEMRETGRVSVEKDVVTEHRSMDVPVTREEVVVERRPVDRRPTDQPIGTGDERIDVTVREEEVDVQKRPVVYEEVEVGKRTTKETRRVEGEVRREVADVDTSGRIAERDESPRTDPRRTDR
jgi:uncharacterized protein (TIGR02271 family)